MPITTQPSVVGIQAKFFRSGGAFTVPSAGTASAASLPGAADPAWIPLGLVSEATMTPGQEEIEVFAPMPGRKVLTDVIPAKDQITYKITSQEQSPIAYEAIFKSAALTSGSSTATPFAATPLKGWLIIEKYDSNDVKLLTETYWVYLKVTGDVAFGDSLTTYEFEARVLNNTLNAVSFP